MIPFNRSFVNTFFQKFSQNFLRIFSKSADFTFAYKKQEQPRQEQAPALPACAIKTPGGWIIRRALFVILP